MKARLLMAALAGLLGTGEAMATLPCNESTPSGCLNGVSTSVTATDNLRVDTGKVAAQTNRRVKEELLETAGLYSLRSGRAAGEGIDGWGAWLSYGRSDYSSNMPINSAVQPVASYDANLNNVLVGLDLLLREQFVVGVAFGWEDGTADTAFNGGGQEQDGWTLAPYAAWLISDIFSVDLAGGYSALSYDQRRIDPGSAAGTPAYILGEFDSDRWFVSANLNATLDLSGWLLSGRAGYLYTEEDQDGYTETGGVGAARTVRDRHVDLAQAQVALEVSYAFGSLEPYAMADYRLDIQRDEGTAAGGLPGSVGGTQPDDDDEFNAGIGLRWFGSNGLSASLEFSHTTGREAFDNNTLLFSLRGDF